MHVDGPAWLDLAAGSVSTQPASPVALHETSSLQLLLRVCRAYETCRFHVSSVLARIQSVAYRVRTVTRRRYHLYEYTRN